MKSDQNEKFLSVCLVSVLLLHNITENFTLRKLYEIDQNNEIVHFELFDTETSNTKSFCVHHKSYPKFLPTDELLYGKILFYFLWINSVFCKQCLVNDHLRYTVFFNDLITIKRKLLK